MKSFDELVYCGRAPVCDCKIVVDAQKTPFDGCEEGGRHAYGHMCCKIVHNLDVLCVLQNDYAVRSFLQQGGSDRVKRICVQLQERTIGAIPSNKTWNCRSLIPLTTCELRQIGQCASVY